MEAVPGSNGLAFGADDALAKIGVLQALVCDVVLHHFGHRPLVEKLAGLVVVAEAGVDFFG